MADINSPEFFDVGRNRFAMQAYAEQKARLGVSPEERIEAQLKTQGQKAAEEMQAQLDSQKKAKWENSYNKLMADIDARIVENKQWFKDHPNAPRTESREHKVARMGYERRAKYGY